MMLRTLALVILMDFFWSTLYSSRAHSINNSWGWNSLRILFKPFTGSYFNELKMN